MVSLEGGKGYGDGAEGQGAWGSVVDPFQGHIDTLAAFFGRLCREVPCSIVRYRLTMGMDLESLRCFVAVAECLHFREAAAKVGLSPAALSDRVKALEDELRISLFVRTTRKVELTEAGLRLLPHARGLLDGAARCRHIALGDAATQPYSLTLGTRYELGLSWLCPALPILRSHHPERTVHLYMGDSDALFDRVESGRIDACVLSSQRLRARLVAVPLHLEAYVFVGPAGATGPRTATAAASATLIEASSDLPLSRYLLDALPDGREWRFGSHLYLGGIGAMRELVRAGMGVAVLPRYFVADDLAAGHLVDLLPDLPLPVDHFRLIWREDHPREAELRRLAGELQELPLR